MLIQINGQQTKIITNLIIKIIQGYIRKYNEIFGEYRRKRFSITIGDELPSGVLQLATVYIKKEKSKGRR